MPVRAILGLTPKLPLSRPSAISIKALAIIFFSMLMGLPPLLFFACEESSRELLHGLGDHLLDFFLTYARRFLCAGVGLDNEGYAVEQVGHAAEEQRSLAYYHYPLHLAVHYGVAHMAYAGHCRWEYGPEWEPSR